MEYYHYSALHDPTQDIRLVEILPGNFNDDIRVRINHSTLIPLRSKSDGRLSLCELQETIPEPWKVYETPDGRFIFRYVEEAGWLNSWDHPDPEFDRSKYDLPDACHIREPKYEALSYVWGTPESSHYIAVETVLALEEPHGSALHNKWTRLPVRPNLMDALRYLRQSDMSRTLWIDAICINQRDNAEKGVQIQLMTSIFASAQRVVIWFGPATSGSQLALSTLQHLSLHFEDTIDGRRLCSPDSDEFFWINRDQKLPYEESTWTAIHCLLQRAWFTRLWTIQEAVLANRMAIVQCGADTILLSELRRAVQCLRGNNKLPSPALSKLLLECTGILGLRLGFTVNDILMITRHRGCSVAKDRIYGILGLFPPQFSAKLRVCYDDSLSTGQLYKDVFLLHSEFTQRLDLFKHCDVVGRFINEPSWVPDLSARRPHASYLVPQFSAACSMAQVVYDKAGQIRVLGLSAAKVSHVSDRMPHDWNAICEYIHQQLHSTDTLKSITKEHLLDAYALVIINGRVKERWPTFGYPSLRDWVEEVESGTHAHRKPKFQGLVQTALMTCQWRRLVETNEGHVGLAPDGTRPGETLHNPRICHILIVSTADAKSHAKLGDHIVVLLGCPSPLVVRAQEGSFEVIGECFVHGLHDAISLLGPLPHLWKVVGGWGHGNRYLFRFFNTDTGESTPEDPRLASLAECDWERFDHQPDANDPELYDFFTHKKSGEIMNSDPRMLPENLEANGVKLTEFCLV